MDKSEVLARRYAILVVPDPDGDGFVADVPDFPGVCAGGDTPAEALQSAYDGVASVLDSMIEHDDPIPEPSIAPALP